MTQNPQVDHNKNFSLWLDLFRWVAAFSVLVAHVGLVALLPYSQTRAPSIVAISYSFAAGFAHQAVMVFFVLSGFLVGGSFLRSHKDGTFNFATYLLKRLVRLWIVIIPVLVVAYILAQLALNQFAGNQMALYPADGASRLTPGQFLCTVMFLQTVACAAFAFDAPLWSLASEFIYYLAFPAMTLAAIRLAGWGRIVALLAIAAALLGLTAVQFSGSPIAPYFLIWVIGAYVAGMPRPRVVAPIWLSATLFVLALLASRVLMIQGPEAAPIILQFVYDVVIALTFSNLVISMRFAKRLLAPPLSELNRYLSNFSFTLYCLHYPLTLFLAAICLHYLGTGYRMQSSDVGAQTWLFVFGYIAIVILASWLMSLVTERQTDNLRRAIFRSGGHTFHARRKQTR